MDIQTLNYVIKQLALIDQPYITGEELKRYVSNFRNNLELEIDNTLKMMYTELEGNEGDV